MKIRTTRIFLLVILVSSCKPADRQDVHSEHSGNPILSGWYADPEGIIFDGEYWIYPTYSDHYESPDTSTGMSEKQMELRKNAINKQYLIQTFFDAFSSKDLIKWEKHSHVLDIKDVEWASYSMWAPSIIEANNKYYLFFSANDIQSNEELGGIGVAVSDDPGGPFVDAIGKPLINEFHNDAQPIDQFVFRDDDGQYYMYYGGWRHCNVVKLGSDLTSLEEFDDGEYFKEITPEDYVEGPFVLKRNNKYYLMWSEGGWGGPDYRVAYAIGDSPTGPFKRIGTILQQDSTIATGAGHHSVISIPDTDEHYIIYHRRPMNTDDPHHRETCIDRMTFDQHGYINQVKMTFKGVEKRVLMTINAQGKSSKSNDRSIPSDSILINEAGLFCEVNFTIHGIAFDNQGLMYVGGGKDIYTITPEKDVKHFIKLNDTTENTIIWSLQFGPDQALYVAAKDRVIKVSPEGDQTVLIKETFKGPAGVTDLRFDQNGRLFIVYDNVVARCDSDYQKLIIIDGSQFKPQLEWLVGIEFSSDFSKIYLGDCNGKQAFVIPYSSEYIINKSQSFSTNWGQYFARDNIGNVYITSLGSDPAFPDFIMFTPDDRRINIFSLNKVPQHQGNHKKAMAWGLMGFNEHAIYCIIGNSIYVYDLKAFTSSRGNIDEDYDKK